MSSRRALQRMTIGWLVCASLLGFNASSAEGQTASAQGPETRGQFLVGGGPMFGPALINGSYGDDGFYDQLSSPVSVGLLLRGRFMASESVRLGVAPSYEWIWDTDDSDLRIRTLTVPVEVAGRVLRFDASGLWLVAALGYSRSWQDGQHAAGDTTLLATGWSLRLGVELWAPLSSAVGAFVSPALRFDQTYVRNGGAYLDGVGIFGGGLYLLTGIDMAL